MFAVIRTGGKQHRVIEGETLRVEKLDAEAGSTIEIDQVLMVGNGDQVTVGTPLVENGRVTAEVVGHGRGDKIRVVKFRRRKDSKTITGHRQWFTELKVTGISA